MLQENELALLTESFRKSRLGCLICSPSEISSRILSASFAEYGSLSSDDSLSGITSPEERTLYRTTDSVGLTHAHLLLDGKRALLIGPYLSRPFDRREVFSIAEEIGISHARHQYLWEFYSSLPIMPDDSPLYFMLISFLERMWESQSFAVYDRDVHLSFLVEPKEEPGAEALKDKIVSMRNLEKRSEFENEMIRAVSKGQKYKRSSFVSAFSVVNMEKRTPDALRNLKNYNIIMNTLLRKAAESGGVHPSMIDRISSDFAIRIERLSSVSDGPSLMLDMFSGYCDLVRKHSLKRYSPPVRQAVTLIDSDLSADLSASNIARAINVSLGYLSATFSREVGKRLSDFVRERRMELAHDLLIRTDIQIQTVAQYCGILDVHYFSKCFKRHTGLSPKDYRAEQKGGRRSENAPR